MPRGIIPLGNSAGTQGDGMSMGSFAGEDGSVFEDYSQGDVC